jgi:ribonuclease HI
MTITGVFCDGGVILANPSPVGLTWAWCGVDSAGSRVIEHSGYILLPGKWSTNNQSEQIAICLALEGMKDGWAGVVHSDSSIALGRIFEQYKYTNIPQNVIDRTIHSVKRLGKMTYVLMQGHPTKRELKAGIGKSGRPVSIHQVWCDKECHRQGKIAMEVVNEERRKAQIIPVSKSTYNQALLET